MGKEKTNWTPESALPLDQREGFKEKFSNVTQWFYAEAGGNGQFRSDLVKPHILLSETHDEDERKKLVDEVLEKRKEILDEIKNKGVDSGWKIPHAGRFVAFIPDNSITDGAAEMDSEGFFDENDEPGWNTWIDYIKGDEENPGFLVAWVDNEHEAKIGKAIENNPVFSISWLDEMEGVV